MKIFRIAAVVVGALAVLAGGLLAYIAATFDPNDYKPQIVELVREHSQRTLKLEGDIKLALWPGIGAELGKLSLSERNSEKLFMAVDGARFSLKLLPLLSKQLVVDEVTVRGARISLVRDRKARLNLDDLVGGGAAAGGGKAEPRKPAAGGPDRQFAFDIDRVVIADSMLEYRDEAAGTRYALSKLNLQTGRIASSVPADIRLTLAAQAERPKLELAVDLRTRLTLDAGKKSATLEQLVLDIRGRVATLQDLELRLDLPALAATAEAFKAAAAAIDASFRQDSRSVKLRLASPVNGNLQTQQFSLPQLKASLGATGAGLPGQGISGELAGSASADLAKDGVRLDLAGTLAGSALKVRLGIAGFGPSAYSFDIDLDQLDVDRLMPGAAPADKGGATAPVAAGAPAAPAAKPFDLSALKSLRADGNIRIGALTAGNLKLQNLRAGVKAAAGRLTVSPLSAGLYQGRLEGSASVDAAPSIPAFALKQTLSGVSLAPLLKDLANNETLEGRGTITADLHTRGSTVDALKRALGGTAALQVADGAIKGIDIAGAIRSAKARLGALRGEQTQQADARQKTDFSELTASFRIADGVARNNDLSMKSPLLRVGGEGEINIGADTLNYLVKASIVGTSKGQGGREAEDLRGLTVPVRVSGPLKAPSYRLDFGAMVTDTVKQKAEDAVKQRLLERLAPQPGAGGAAPAEGAKSGGARDVLKGLLGR
ncbi:MAG: AsmA family protein [Burkholderiales bacterium]|nr:AsmA family protein [Burkholderiales bacterium]